MKYDVYGVGNALVDKEFEVDDSFFVEHSIEKGLMTLVSHEQQQQLLSVLKDKFGVKNRSGGGSAANTLYAISQFGGNVYFSCKVANDEPGDFYLDQLGDQSIETNTENQREEGTTGRCLVMISPDAERTMHTYLGVSETISVSEINHDAVKNSEYVYIEGYLVTSPSAMAAITELKQLAEQNQVKTAMTFSDPSMLEYFRDNVIEVLGSGVDLLFCNETEALLYTGADTLEKACELMKSKARQFAITRGAEGALLYDGENYINIEPHTVKAIDTNGAGDMFAGAFLYAITNGKDFETAGKLASLASASVVSRFGPRLQADMHKEIIAEVM
ncbi:MAG: adenosine kinase [SAR86 cluster bacterium]|uniref:Adenosine kinase n=1 Tax=SAR86 cluster bacterium TaxID=2030880 RepID=A0A2A5AY23_9GAMM|nr:MAG: adenosine kinase [SAR86 cluster bacterium]